MTRKRNRENLHHVLCEPCFYCDGAGELKSKRTLCYEIFRRIQRETIHDDSTGIHVLVHPKIGEMLFKEEAHNVELLEKSLEREITIVSKPEFHLEQYKIKYL
jgi:ribonuclease G